MIARCTASSYARIAARLAQRRLDDLAGRQLHDVEDRLGIAGESAGTITLPLTLAWMRRIQSASRFRARAMRRRPAAPRAAWIFALGLRAQLRLALAPRRSHRGHLLLLPLLASSASRRSSSLRFVLDCFSFSASRVSSRSVSSRTLRSCSCLALSAMSAACGSGFSTTGLRARAAARARRRAARAEAAGGGDGTTGALTGRRVELRHHRRRACGSAIAPRTRARRESRAAPRPRARTPSRGPSLRRGCAVGLRRVVIVCGRSRA